MYPQPQFLQLFMDDIKKRIDKYIPEWFKKPLKITENEIVNDYKMIYTSKIREQIFNYYYFLDLEKLYNTPNTLTEKEFMEKYDDLACSVWSKMDKHGECFGGYWKYPDGSYE